MWENRTRGTIDLDEENLARDRIATWIMENSQQIQTCRQCPGCFKVSTIIANNQAVGQTNMNTFMV